MHSKPAAASQDTWRIVIIDDHPLVRAGLGSLINAEPDMEVIGEAEGIADGMALMQVKPDLAIIDLSLNDGNGLELVKRLRNRHADVRLLVCSMHDEVLFAQRALNAGAMGYINKQEATTNVVKAMRDVLAGNIYLSSQMTARVLTGLAKGNKDFITAPVHSLTDRELEVFDLIGKGIGTSAIAKKLNLSVKTIETHREKIKKKLNLHSASELNRAALQWTMDQN
jgi:DNA-binding NarL/FixJ family response regulator